MQLNFLTEVDAIWWTCQRRELMFYLLLKTLDILPSTACLSAWLMSYFVMLLSLIRFPFFALMIIFLSFFFNYYYFACESIWWWSFEFAICNALFGGKDYRAECIIFLESWRPCCYVNQGMNCRSLINVSLFLTNFNIVNGLEFINLIWLYMSYG